MNQKHNLSVNTSNILSANKKLPAEVNKPALRPSSGVRKAFQGLESQRKNVKSSLEKFQLPKQGPAKTISTSSNVLKQSTSPKLVNSTSASSRPSLETKPRPSFESKPNLKPTLQSKLSLDSKPSLRPSLELKPSLRPSLELKPSLRPSLVFKSSLKPPSRLAQRLLVSSQQRVLLSKEEIQQLTCKFEALSTTIIRLATSDCPISVRSLESLLTKEVAGCLGSAVNSAKFAEAFVRETRRLLYGLNCQFEEGKVNSQLIKGRKGGQRPFLRANAATTACYRDLYLKELVMNVLQEMCSAVDVEEVTSAANKHRVDGVVRDMVSLEPGVFQSEEPPIQKSLSHNHHEVRSTPRETDKLFPEHQVSQADVDRPKTATAEVTDKNVPVDSIKHDNNGKVNKIEDKNTCSKNQSDLAKNFVGFGDNHQPPGALKTNDSNILDSDSIQSIRPKLEKIVQCEISLAHDKKRAILDSFQRAPFEFSSEASVDNIVSDSEMCDDTDDEINSDETLLFLKALKADAAHNLLNKCTISSKCSLLEAVEERCEENKEVAHCCVERCSIGTISSFGEKFRFTKGENGESTQDEALTWIESEILSYKFFHEEVSMPTIAEELEDEGNDNIVRAVKSMSWSDESTEAGEIVQQMKKALNAFDHVKKFSENNVLVNSQITDPPKHFSYRSDHDFTVEEMAYILKNISIKVCQIPMCTEKRGSYFNYVSFPLTSSQRIQLTHHLTLLEKALGGFILPDSDTTSDFQLDGENLTATTNKLSSLFNVISEKLSHAPTELRRQPIAFLAPPESLMKTLALLATSDFFNECFITGILEVQNTKKDTSLHDFDISKGPEQAFEFYNENHIGKVCTKPEKDLEIVKAVSLQSQKSSGEMFPMVHPEVNRENKLNLAFKRFETKVRNCVDVHDNTSKYEHYLGMSSAVMTVKNVSDMFVFLSAVLNDIPDRIKSEKMSSLHPPATLLTALNILYNAEDGGCFTEAQKSTSFNSLTVQSVADLFLALSKTFEDLPERVKHSNVLELDPPWSLLSAINLLTSLPFNSVLDSGSEEGVEFSSAGDCRNHDDEDSQDNFYDALDTSSQLMCEPNSGT